MGKCSLEKFDSPIVMINQSYQGEDWSVVASYVSEQDVIEVGDEVRLAEIGWHVSVTLPNLDDVNFDQAFSTPEAALEFGINQIVSDSLTSAMSFEHDPKDIGHSFGEFKSFI